MKNYIRLLAGVGVVSMVFTNGLEAKVQTIRSVVHFDNVLTDTPVSVVVFYNRSNGLRNSWQFNRIVDHVSREQRYKDAKLKFLAVDANRHDLLCLFDRYEIKDDVCPFVQVFLRNRPMRNAFMNKCFCQDELKQFIERYLARALTTEINHQKVRQQLAQAPRAYYAADYYNPFYMMPYFNYTPPSDWPDKGPEWVGIDVD